MIVRRARWNWLVWALVFGAGAVLWSLAVARGMEQSPVVALPFALSMMGAAAVMTIGIWRMTARVPWQATRVRFFSANFAAMSVFAVLYTAAQGLPYVFERPLIQCLRAPFAASVAGWNLLMGAWLYLSIAGVCYSRRADEALRASERARSDARLKARDAQLAALSAQLQPHFLFNALHTVSALVHVDPDRADRALDELGKLLRYALHQPGEDVPLGREWEFTRDYLAFEGLRLGDRLRLDVDVQASALDVPVPPFILQPLVENAVRHGVSDSADGGDVAIRISRDHGIVTLRVRNSLGNADGGAGMAGTGLQRLRDRLALKYGPGAAGVSTEIGATFAVTVTLPEESREAEG